jgi:tRNA (guanine-N7-)-methyltransferase
MGRRALRKINPALDISTHYRLLDDLVPPFDLEAWFGGVAPLEVEVGSGKGLFLAGAASACPTHHFLGIEIAHKYAEFIAARLVRQNLTNARVLEGDGLRFFREFLPDNYLEAVHVYFPDPWWKLRHRKRRVLNEPFVRDVERVLRPGGKLHFWTDVEEYYLTSLELIRQSTTLRGPLAVDERPAAHDLDFHTHFERRTRKAGLPVYRSEFCKLSMPANP